MKLQLVCLFVSIACAFATPVLNVDHEWSNFKLKHGKEYATPDEETKRQTIFTQSLKLIEEHNKKYEEGLVTFSLSVNQFSDMSDEEISMRKGLLPEANFKDLGIQAKQFQRPENPDLPNELDWNAKGAVTPIKNQGACESCWAFSTTGTLEGAYFLKTGQLTELSEKNLMDCAGPEYGSNSCHRGTYVGALVYVSENGGIDSEESYPYQPVDGECHYDAKDNVFKNVSIKNIYYTEPDNEVDLKIALATMGPIAIAIDSSDRAFQLYKEGVYYNKHCGSVDHGVLLVGYGTENGIDYWLIKNSWGEEWGNKGFGKMARNRCSNCGIASIPFFAELS